jgi:hypothetical protein
MCSPRSTRCRIVAKRRDQFIPAYQLGNYPVFNFLLCFITNEQARKHEDGEGQSMASLGFWFSRTLRGEALDTPTVNVVQGYIAPFSASSLPKTKSLGQRPRKVRENPGQAPVAVGHRERKGPE